jgi:phosphatidylserine/phosphatidylglycerophosphate/cardiolipin synthase-like enzyme
VLEREGFPFDKEHEPESRQREVIRIRPLKWFVAYREAQLEAWYRKDRDEWDWLLQRGGGEEIEVSAKLRELESEGELIIPLEERREVPASVVADEVHAAVEEAQQAAKPALLETEAHREALRDAILEARNELIIVSPWLRTAAVDGEFLGWLRTTLARNRGVRITIGYGIDKAPGKQRDPGVRDQEEALRRLRDLERTARGRLRIVDVGNTHEKVVICDDRFAIITSFNFLSFNPRPGKGIRREMGFRVTDAAVVSQARKRLAGALGIQAAG